MVYGMERMEPAAMPAQSALPLETRERGRLAKDRPGRAATFPEPAGSPGELPLRPSASPPAACPAAPGPGIPETPRPDTLRKGRGAVGNPAGRYEKFRTDPFHDGWDAQDDSDFAPPKLRTSLTPDASRSIIARNQSPDIGFDRSINPYRGCEHGCSYCFARPTHAWLGLSPGLDFESRLFFKPDAAALLDAELRRKSYDCAPIAMGTNTDPYQPAEREQEITRSILRVLADFNHPVTLVTKSALVARDIDILAPMAEKGLVRVALSVTTLDRGLARRMEPRAATPARRLATIRSLAEAGIPTGVMAAPVVPGLTDDELEDILEAAREAGAVTAGYILLRLPMEVKEIFAEWLDAHAPLRAKKVLSLVRDIRGGALNDPNFGSRMTGEGPYAKLIEKRFNIAVGRLGFKLDPPPLETGLFRAPLARGGQMSLF